MPWAVLDCGTLVHGAEDDLGIQNTREPSAADHIEDHTLDSHHPAGLCQTDAGRCDHKELKECDRP